MAIAVKWLTEVNIYVNFLVLSNFVGLLYFAPNILSEHCVKIVQIRSFFWSVFNPNAGKYRPEKTPYLDTFHAVGGCRLLSSTNFQIFKTFSSFLRSRASGLLMFSGVSIEISGMKWFNRVYNTRYKVPLYL